MDKSLTRRAILKEALAIAPFEGWTYAMLMRASARAGLEPVDLARCFETVEDALQFWSEEANQSLTDYAATRPLDSMKVRERIAELTLYHLRYFDAHREAKRRALHMLMLPHHMPLHLKLTKNTVDLIWRLAGDQSHDYNWYSKRLLLVGVYGSTRLFWLNDKSEDFSETKAFLLRRIEDVMKIGGAFSRVMQKIA